MKTKIVRIGKSLGVCIPKPLIEEAGLEDEVQLRIVESGLLIEGASRPRAGWEKAAQKLRARGEDGLLDELGPSDFDESEWEWEGALLGAAMSTWWRSIQLGAKRSERCDPTQLSRRMN